MNPDPPVSRGRPWPAVVLFVVVLVVFGRVAKHAYTLDSLYFMVEDRRVQEFALGEIWTTDYWHREAGSAAEVDRRPGLYRPVTLTWLGLLYRMADGQDLRERRCPPVNLGNVVLHGLGVALRYLLFLALLGSMPRARLWAFLGALALAVHPVSTEAVCTPVGAAEALSVVFSTASLLFYLRARNDGGSGRWIAHGALLLLALLSKESAVAWPGVVFLIAWMLDGNTAGRAALHALPSFAVVVVWLGLRSLVLGQVLAVNDPTLGLFPLGARLATAFAVIGSYHLPALVWPAHLHPNLTLGDFPPAEGFGDPRTLVGIVAAAAVLGGFLVARKRAPSVALGLAFFGGTLLPVANLVNLIGSLGATRFLYLPIGGLALALAAGAGALANSSGAGRRAAGVGLFALAILIPGGFTLREVGVWKNQESLWRAVVDRYPRSAVGHYGLGVVLRGRLGGGAGGAGLRAQALEHFSSASDAELPVIPGTGGRVQEDLLDLVYQACMNAGSSHLEMAQQALRARDLARFREEAAPALVKYEKAGAIAQRGLALGSGARTTWSVLAGKATSARMEVLLQEVALAPSGEKAAINQRLERSLEELGSQLGDDLRVDLKRAQVLTKGVPNADYARSVAALYERAKTSQGDPEARSAVIMTHMGLLQAGGRQTERTIVFLDSVLEGLVTASSADLFNAGRQACGSGHPRLVALGKKALARFLDESGKALGPQRQEARRILGSLPPGR